MTDKIIISRKEIEALQRWQDDKEIANNCYEDDDGYFILYDDLRALLDKAEVVRSEAVAYYWVDKDGNKLYSAPYFGLPSNETVESANLRQHYRVPLYTTPQPSRIAELEESNSNLKSQWMYYQDLLSLNGFDGITDCIHVNKKLQKQVTELEAEVSRLNAIVVDDKKDKLKIAVEYLEQECGNRCNAEYNPCAARQVLQQIEKED